MKISKDESVVKYPAQIYYNVCELPCGRIQDLPVEERGEFAQRLYGQTIPRVTGLPQAEQDYFYICDYLEWKAGLPVMD